MSKKPGKHRWSLTLLYSTAFFLIQLAAVLITAALSFLLTKLGVLDNLGIPRNSGFAMLIVMLLISVLVGSVVAIGAVKIPLRPFNRLINNIDRLAAGDFTARMHYGKVMGDNPVFQELSESFNAMAEELENTQMLRSDFINNFSHEFKTPIVSIAGFAKLLRRGNLTDAQISAIVHNEGVIGLNLCPAFLGLGRNMDAVLAHIDHFLCMDARENLCIGTDFDGIESLPEGITGVESMEELYEQMLAHRFSEALVQDIFFHNLHRFLGEAL